MKEITGKFNTAKIFTDNIDNATESQIKTFLDQEYLKDSTIRIMPDCHSGKGAVIGTTMTIHDKIVPNMVGVDIGCSVLAVKLKEKRIDLPNLDSIIRKYIPIGMNIHEASIVEFDELDDLKCIRFIDKEYMNRSLGSCGSGNHYIEIDRDTDGYLWLTIHTGSRNLGVQVCKHYQDLAYEDLRTNGKSLNDYSTELINSLKSQGRHREINTELAKLKKWYSEQSTEIPHMLAYCTGSLMDDYLHDMAIVQRFAKLNRYTIAKIIMKKAKLHEVDYIDTTHNYIDLENMILRKGAVSAQSGERLIIPMNMRDGALICIGKGNPDWNYSAPHGAGRIMSRSQARDSINMSEYKKSMNGIYTTSVSRDTVDEAPMAYKPMDEIIKNIGDTVDIVDIIKPVYNIKAPDNN